MSFCTRCGQPAGGTLKFCTNCGARLQVAGSQDTPVTPAPTGPPPPRAVTPSPPPPWPQRSEPEYPEPVDPESVDPESVDPEPPTLTTAFPPAGAADPFSRPPALPGPGRRRIPAWGIAAAVVVLVAAALGGWYVATQHGSTAAATGQRPASAKPSAGGGGSLAASSPSNQLATPTGSPTSSTPTGSPTTSTPTAGGGSQVALGPGVSGQTAGSVAAFASQYFAAVNSHDYQAYISLFAPGADAGMDAQKFQDGYASTTDSSEALVALGGTASGKTAASLTFVSHQAAASSATHTACTSWRITLYLVSSGTSYLISHPPASYHASFRPCS